MDDLRQEGEEAAAHTYDGVGARIANVLNAAEEAAARIKRDARRAAEAERQKVIEEARAYAASVRRDADNQAVRVLATAQAAADATRDQACTEASHVEEDSRRRREDLSIEAHLLEQRVERALDALRHISSELAGVARHARVPLEPEPEAGGVPPRLPEHELQP